MLSQLLQIATDYATLPDLNTIDIDDITFFYNPLIDNLVKFQKDLNKNGK